MSDTADPGIASSSTDAAHSTPGELIAEQDVEKLAVTSDEPETKKRKVDIKPAKPDKLEQRLGGILCCAVCLDLPRNAIYQCPNGHLMCAGCFTHLLLRKLLVSYHLSASFATKNFPAMFWRTMSRNNVKKGLSTASSV
uniref:Cysteine and histidine-rich protein 1 n=1 Tax=Cacopsylla melanoneura TaxID=428564 RepID=A0A8D8X1S1_9HEMI